MLYWESLVRIAEYAQVSGMNPSVSNIMTLSYWSGFSQPSLRSSIPHPYPLLLYVLTDGDTNNINTSWTAIKELVTVIREHILFTYLTDLRSRTVEYLTRVFVSTSSSAIRTTIRKPITTDCHGVFLRADHKSRSSKIRSSSGLWKLSTVACELAWITGMLPAMPLISLSTPRINVVSLSLRVWSAFWTQIPRFDARHEHIAYLTESGSIRSGH